MLFANISLPKGLYYFLPKAKTDEEKKHIVVQIILVSCLTTILFCILIGLSSPLLSTWMKNPFLNKTVLVLPALIFFLSVNSAFEPFLISTGRIKFLAIFEIIFGVAQLLCVVIPLACGYSLMAILYFMLLTGFLKFALLIFFIRLIKGTFYKKQIFSGIREKANYSFPLMFSTMIGAIGKRIDQFMISSIFRPAEFAIYARGAFELPLVSILPMTISNMLLPEYSKEFSAGNKSKVANLFSDSARQVALFFFPLTVLLIILSEPFIIFMFSEKYIESSPIFAVYLLSLPLRITVYGAIPRAAGETDVNLKGVIVFVISNITVSYALIHFYGSIGAAWGTNIALFLNVAYVLKKNSLILETPLSKILPWRSLLKIMIASLISGLGIIFLLQYLKEPFFKLAFSSIFFIIIYLSANVLLGNFEAPEKNFIKKYWHKVTSVF